MQLVLKNTALSSSTTPPIHVRVGSDTSEKMSSNIITRKNKPSAPGAELKIMCLFLPCCMKLDLIHSTNSSLFQNISNFQT